MKPWSQGWLTAAGAYPGFCSIKRLEVFLLPLDGMLVHRRTLPRNFVRFPQQIAGIHLYTWGERGTVRVKCLAQEHNTLSPDRARTRTARSGVERTKHEAAAPPPSHYQGTTLKPASTNLYSLDSLWEPLLLQSLYDSVNFHNKHLCQVTVLFKFKELFLQKEIGNEILRLTGQKTSARLPI